jgi:hypothetical protein
VHACCSETASGCTREALAESVSVASFTCFACCLSSITDSLTSAKPVAHHLQKLHAAGTPLPAADSSRCTQQLCVQGMGDTACFFLLECYSCFIQSHTAFAACIVHGVTDR